MKTIGNTTLVEHGILQEAADYRAHVCPRAKRIYVFPTGPAKLLVTSGKYKVRSVFIGSVETARGVAVPIVDFQHIQEIELSELRWDKLAFSDSDDESKKGAKAVRAVTFALHGGLVCLPWSALAVSRATDLVGVDLIATGTHKVQVKCDFKGGAKQFGGTGNLFLQTMECNPYGMY